MRIPRGWFVRVVTASFLLLSLAPSATTPVGAASDPLLKLDSALLARRTLTGRTRVVVRTTGNGAIGQVVALVQLLGGRLVRRLPIIDAVAIDAPNLTLPVVAASPLVARMSLDRVVSAAMERTGATIGATAVREQLGYDGAGVGVAVIDSGVAPSHDDLADAAGGAQRVDRFVDFVNGREAAYDDYGHGTHVGNHLERGGVLTAAANAWATDVTWGASATGAGTAIVWGVKDGEPWQAAAPSLARNVVWGMLCDGADCLVPWDAHTVSGTSEGEEDTVVWGTRCSDPSCEPVVWSQ